LRVALAGVGRMGGAIAARIRAAGHDLTLYDPAPPPGVDSEPSLADAASGRELAMLCLPDATAVEASVPGLLEARPKACVDLTSSVPSITRRVGATLAAAGIGFFDCGLSGGVQGAREGRLTAMAGGDPELLARVRPVLASFSSNILWAGGLGSGHAVKAINNALSAVSLTAASEALVLAAGLGAVESEAVAQFNAGPARSQNSEVKLPRDILTRSYAAGFTCGLMQKDLATAIGMARHHDVPAPVTSGAVEVWQEVTLAAGTSADFTHVHSVIESRSRTSGEIAGFDLAVVGRALAAVNLIAVMEMLRVADAEGLDRRRTLDIINTSSGRSEATRSGAGGDPDREALLETAEWSRRAGAWTPLISLASSQ
jgi:3-hydroxyisobutyrate dehydrogenase